jgi:hypothetical protein
VAVYHDIGKLTLMTGHRSSDVMWEHYHRGVREEDAKVFWQIYPPEDVMKNVIPFKKASA